MRKSRFTKAQIIGMPTAEVCRRHGLNPATFYKPKAKYGGMEVPEAARLKVVLSRLGSGLPSHSGSLSFECQGAFAT